VTLTYETLTIDLLSLRWWKFDEVLTETILHSFWDTVFM